VSLGGSRILDHAQRGAVDTTAILHKRRKRTIVALLSAFEQEIEPLIQPGNNDAIDSFKGALRKRLTGDTFEAIALTRGGAVNGHAVELAEQLTSDQTED
jgi:hypothetical protein